MGESSYKLYGRLLRLGADWQVVNIEIDDPHDVIHVTISYCHNEWIDKSIGEIFPIYDYRQERVWRHLDSLEHATFIHCRLPRIQTADGKTHTIEVGWADSGISHTKKSSPTAVRELF